MKDGEGNWDSEVNLYNHRTGGVYIIHAYEDLEGERRFLGEFRCYVKHAVIPKEHVCVEQIGPEYIRICFIGDVPYEHIEFTVWSEENSQNDLKWYQARLDNDGAWSCIVNLDDHTRVGTLHVLAYEAGGEKSTLLDNVSIYLSP